MQKALESFGAQLRRLAVLSHNGSFLPDGGEWISWRDLPDWLQELRRSDRPREPLLEPRQVDLLLAQLRARGFRWVGMPKPQPQPMLFARLLGAAFLALVVGYWFGLAEVERQVFPRSAVWAGIVSNGLASLLLFKSGFAGEWKGWSAKARVYLWGSALVTMFVTLGLAYCLALALR